MGALPGFVTIYSCSGVFKGFSGCLGFLPLIERIEGM